MKIFTSNTVNIDTLGGYTYSQVMNNKNCSKNPKFWYILEHTKGTSEPRYLFKSKVAESWEFFDSETENDIRNTNQIYLKFKDVTKFVEPSNYFREHKEYPYSNIPDTIEYNKYWDDLEDKGENGFEVEGVRITGRHFFMINFGRFRARPVDQFGNETSTRKIWTFLKFVDHQYYMWNELEECLLEGPYDKMNKVKYLEWFPEKDEEDFQMLKLQNFVISKGRRKGWTAAIGIGGISYNFTFKESSMSVIAAYEKGKYGPALRAVHNTKAFLDSKTPWKRRVDIKGTHDHFISGVEIIDEFGVKTKEGYMSEVTALSFKDNAFKAVGESCDFIDIEEAGIFHNLITSYKVSMEPLIRDGETPIGICVVGGTAGDMESGASEGLSTMMYNPSIYNFKAYQNIYEKQNLVTESGWFIDDLWYSPITEKKEAILKIDSSERTKRVLDTFDENYITTVDKHGNSYRYLSNLILNRKREKNRKTSTLAYQKFITQQPKYLSEAFLLNESSPFDTATAKEVLGEIKVHPPAYRKGTFALTRGIPVFRDNIDLVDVDEYAFTGPDTTGGWVIYEEPITLNGEIPTWRYLAGLDPIDFGSDESSSEGKHSMAATFVIDSITRNIVAEYIGRPPKADDYFEQVWRGIEFYNAYLLYENNLKSLFSYFKLKNKTHLLANEPDSLKGRTGYNSNKRLKGFHATAASNSYARELINTWSLEEVPIGQEEDGQVVYMPRMYEIKSKGLLQEIILWNSKGNFDRISALGAVLILLFDRTYDEGEILQQEASILDGGVFEKMRSFINKKTKFNFK
ncbi:MAG: hypothetical protein GY775_19380 [Candidatus Scalindua sp.]|nr:hypothetical protein [Candidatus Scalindua sp.]